MDELAPYPSLWKELKGRLKPPEVDEAQRIIGTKLIQDVEDLHMELSALSEILRDYREHTDSKAASLEYQRQLLINPQRLLVQKEMQMFVETLRMEAQRFGSDYLPEKAIQDQNERDILDYVVEGGDQAIASRPTSAGSRPSSRDSVFSASSTDKKDVKRPFSRDGRRPKSASRPAVVSTVDLNSLEQQVQVIREALHEESLSLLQEIALVQLCIEDEHEYLVKMESRPPSLEELHSLNDKLKALALQASKHALVVSSMNSQTEAASRLEGRLRLNHPSRKKKDGNLQEERPPTETMTARPGRRIVVEHNNAIYNSHSLNHHRNNSNTIHSNNISINNYSTTAAAAAATATMMDEKIHDGNTSMSPPFDQSKTIAKPRRKKRTAVTDFDSPPLS